MKGGAKTAIEAHRHEVRPSSSSLCRASAIQCATLLCLRMRLCECTQADAAGGPTDNAGLIPACRASSLHAARRMRW